MENFRERKLSQISEKSDFTEKTFVDCSLLPRQKTPHPQICKENFREDTKPRNLQKFSPLKFSCYTVVLRSTAAVLSCCGGKDICLHFQDCFCYQNTHTMCHVTKYCNVIGPHYNVWWDTSCAHSSLDPSLSFRSGCGLGVACETRVCCMCTCIVHVRMYTIVWHGKQGES